MAFRIKWLKKYKTKSKGTDILKKKGKPEVFSALEVANICGVVNQTAINWIKSGHLKAFATPGGQYRVYPDDLVSFMKSRKMRIPETLAKMCSCSEAGNKTLLIVDDDRGLNSVIARFLQKKYENTGLEIFQAFDGFEAGVLMTQKHPKVLILDLDLPGVDGLSLCRKIKEDENFGKPLIIVVTALEDAQAEASVRELGVEHFFRKPLNLLELAEVLEKSRGGGAQFNKFCRIKQVRG